MSELHLTRTHQSAPEIRQSRLRRDWMDATYDKHAYRCLPVTTANVNGWEFVLQQEVRVFWDGGNAVPKITSGEFYTCCEGTQSRAIANCNKIGMIDFHLGWIIGTEPGYDTWITGPPNYFIDGAVPLTASVPSHWWPDEVQVNWKITKIGEEVVFPAGMPFGFFFVYRNDVLSDTTITVENLWDKPDLIEARKSYNDAKVTKMKEQPWTWMNGIRTGLDENGNRIGPRHDGLLRLAAPNTIDEDQTDA